MRSPLTALVLAAAATLLAAPAHPAPPDPFVLPPPAPPPPDPFVVPPVEAPPIGLIESGSPEARRLGERIEDPDARRRREEAWTRDSAFPANPDTVPGRYRFDLRLRQRVDSAAGLVDMTCFANSRDASLLCPDWGLTGWTLGVSPAQGQLEFVLRQADGDVLACGQHRDLGPSCVQLGEQIGPAFAWLRNSVLLQGFLDSIADTPQVLGEAPAAGAGGVQGVRGRTADGFLQLWFDRHASPIATRMPWIGLGVGVLRDERARVVRTVRRARMEGADRDGGDIVLDLVELAPARLERDLAGYRLVTAFTAQAQEEAMSLSARLHAMQREAVGIRAELDACPSGRDGRDCRAHHRDRLRALDDRARALALGFGQRHGLPVDD